MKNSTHLLNVEKEVSIDLVDAENEASLPRQNMRWALIRVQR